MVAGRSRYGAEASSSHATPCLGQSSDELGAGAGARRCTPHFADAQEEEQLWEELRDHGTSLNRALNEALRIHGGPAWRVFQVRNHSLAFCLSSSLCCFRALSSRCDTYRSSFAGGRSWSSAPVTGMAPLTS
jgi:hypothetical protein